VVADKVVTASGDGGHRPAWLDMPTAAMLLGALATRTDVTGCVTLNHPAAATARVLAEAVGPALGLEVAVRLGAKTSDGLLCGGDEPLDVSRMSALWPERTWPAAVTLWRDWLRAAGAAYTAGAA
jgi:hypothetical protein